MKIHNDQKKNSIIQFTNFQGGKKMQYLTFKL